MYRHTRLNYDPEATASKSKQQIYENLKSYAHEKGILVNGVEYPAFYGNGGFLRGARADKDIQPYEAIIAAPQTSLLITSRLWEDKELAELGVKYPEYLALANDGMEAYFLVAIYLLRERCKGDDSPVKSYIELNSNQDVYFWDDQKVLDYAKDPVLKFRLKYCRDQTHNDWKKVQRIEQENPTLFRRKLTKQDFDWAYFFAYSRCFGYQMPGKVYPPVIDLLNYAAEDNNFFAFLIHKKYEQMSDEECQKVNYKKQTQGIDLSHLFPDWKPSKGVEDKRDSINFVEKFDHKVENYQRLSARQSFELALKTIRKLLVENQFLQIWDIPDFIGNHVAEFTAFNNINTGLSIQTQLQNLEALLKSPDSRPKYGKELFILKEPESGTGSSNAQSEPTYPKYDRRCYPWYDPEDPDVYLVCWNETDEIVPKGSELRLNYGGRSNPSIMGTYGFAMEDYAWSEIDFYLYNEALVQKHKLATPLCYADFDSKVELNGETISTDEVSGPYYARPGRFNLLLMMKLRSLATKDLSSGQEDAWRITDLQIEEELLLKYKSIFVSFLEQYSRTKEEFDSEFQRFYKGETSFGQFCILTGEYEHFKIAKKHIMFCDLLHSILQDFKANSCDPNNLKEIYLKERECCKEGKESYLEILLGCSLYLQQLYHVPTVQK